MTLTSSYVYDNKEMYNGWKDYKTWNIALYINNTEEWYELAKNSSNYEHFIDQVAQKEHTHYTPDGVSLEDGNIEELDVLIKEIS